MRIASVWLKVAASMLAAAAILSSDLAAAEPTSVDVVVYGGTSGGVAAAIQAANMGKSVVLVEPGEHVGGLTSGGLGATDIGNKAAIGGLSRGFYERIGEHYADEDAWKWQKPDAFQSSRQKTGEQAMWTFEPHVAEAVYREMLQEAEVPVVHGERLDLDDGVTKEGNRIASIAMESGRTFRGKMFIDATYEGDLMAKAGVSYTVGREANATYGETLNGVQVGHAVHHQFIKNVDPYVKPGDPDSGLLPGIEPTPPPADGTGDRRVQAYNLRMCTTDVPENQAEWVKPKDYDPAWYELLLRNCEAGDLRVPWNPVMMPNRKTDTNNNFAISTDFIGQNYEYPDGDYETRERIFQAHLSWQQGLTWTLANSDRVPESVQRQFQKWKPARDEFTKTGHWPHQLYVREARRMVTDYVMTQHDCQGRREAEDPVGLAAYTMDSHNIQRYVTKDGYVRNEGDVQVGGFSPYPISYRSIRPRKAECSNLLVPVCLGASHIAYGSIRMEPVFMVLGQSAATAACQAIDAGVAVQDIDYEKLRERLLADRQVLEWTGPKRTPPIAAESLKGVVIDDDKAELTGAWLTSSATPGYVGLGYRHDDAAGRGEKRAVYSAKLPKPGRYEVRLFYSPNANRATNVPVVVTAADGEHAKKVNQRKTPEGGSVSLGTYEFDETGQVTVSNTGTDGHVILDAVQFLPAK
jgi:hypothetical protein